MPLVNVSMFVMVRFGRRMPVFFNSMMVAFTKLWRKDTGIDTSTAVVDDVPAKVCPNNQ